jgi:hypothetical protein
MKTCLEARGHEAETADLCHDDAGLVWETTGGISDQGRPAPLWLKARVRTIGFRRNDLERTHWKKVCLSMFEE